MSAALGEALVAPATAWTMARGRIALDRPVVVGILNITPDSFSDGGKYVEPAAAVAHAEAMVAAGAGMIDVGAESTRPGRPEPVTEADEWSRLAKVWALLQRHRAEVYPEDIQDLAPFVLGHRIWLGPHAAAHGLTAEEVIRDVIAQVPVP